MLAARTTPVAIGLIVATSTAGFFFGPLGAGAVVFIVLTMVGLGFVAGAVTEPQPPSVARKPPVVPAPAPTANGAEPGEPERLFAGLGGVILLAVITRIAMVILLNASSLWLSFAPDALGWEKFGQQVLDYWTGATMFPEPWMQEVNGRTLYSSLNAISLWLFGTARYPLAFINALVGIAAAAVIAKLAQEIWDTQVARRTFILCAFFPSIMVWTCMSIRESYAYLALGAILLGFQRLRRQIALIPLLLVLLGVPLMVTIRAYLVPLIVVAAGLSLFIVRIRQLPYALVGIAALGLLVGIFGEDLGITTALVSEERLEEMHRLRNGLAYGGSAYGTEVDTRTFAGTVAYMPEGIARFLFSPFPWAIRSWRQALTLPESLIWIVFFYQAVRGIYQEARRNLAAIATPWLVCMLVTMAYGIVSGNEGTAYRHRAQVMVVLFMFTAVYQVRDRARRPAAAAPSAVSPASGAGELVGRAVRS